MNHSRAKARARNRHKTCNKHLVWFFTATVLFLQLKLLCWHSWRLKMINHFFFQFWIFQFNYLELYTTYFKYYSYAPVHVYLWGKITNWNLVLLSPHPYDTQHHEQCNKEKQTMNKRDDDKRQTTNKKKKAKVKKITKTTQSLALLINRLASIL